MIVEAGGAGRRVGKASVGYSRRQIPFTAQRKATMSFVISFPCASSCSYKISFRLCTFPIFVLGCMNDKRKRREDELKLTENTNRGVPSAMRVVMYCLTYYACQHDTVRHNEQSPSTVIITSTNIGLLISIHYGK